MKKESAVKISAGILAAVVAANFFLFAFGKSNTAVFWFVILLAAAAAYIALPRLKKTK